MLSAPSQAEALRRKLAILFRVHHWGKPALSQGQKEEPPSMTAFLLVGYMTSVLHSVSRSLFGLAVYCCSLCFNVKALTENELHLGYVLQVEKAALLASWDTASGLPLFWTGLQAPLCCTSCHRPGPQSSMGCPGHRLPWLQPACTSRVPRDPPPPACSLRSLLQRVWQQRRSLSIRGFLRQH